MSVDQTRKTSAPQVPLNRITGLVSCDFLSVEEVMQRAEALTKSSYTHEEIFGEWAHLGLHIGCSPAAGFEYASSVFSLEEWTTSLRSFAPIGDGVFRGVDGWGSDTVIYVRVVANRESGCVDYHCAWDQPDDLWMRVHLRFLDAEGAMGRPGTMLLWSTFHHPYFVPSPDHPDHVQASIAQPGRTWIGDVWRLFPAVHALEAANLKLILEARWPI
jgi:hypothetical protein